MGPLPMRSQSPAAPPSSDVTLPGGPRALRLQSRCHGLRERLEREGAEARGGRGARRAGKIAGGGAGPEGAKERKPPEEGA